MRSKFINILTVAGIGILTVTLKPSAPVPIEQAVGVILLALAILECGRPE